MLDKNQARLRRARQTRLKIREVGAVRLTVHRTNGHIYAQITSSAGDKVLASASTAEKEVRAQLKNSPFAPPPAPRAPCPCPCRCRRRRRRPR